VIARRGGCGDDSNPQGAEYMSSQAQDSDTRTLTASTLAHLQSWAGKTETVSDVITAAPVRGLSATLDRDDPLPVPGTALPPLWHWLSFLPQHRQSEIGPDGHPKRGGFLPPVPLPRRMWAGGRLQWLPGNPLLVGDAVQRISRIESVTHKAGRTGDLLFVLVKHEVHNANGLALTEEHDIVYRAAAQPGDPVPPPIAAEKGAAWQRDIVPDDVLLFRYSALTFNGHRIHYDRKYVTEVEGYPGLIVHGPLIATLLVDLVRRNAPGAFIKSFNFKAVRPTFDLHPFRLNGQAGAAGSPNDLDGRSVRLWAQDHQGWQTMQGTAELA
jgi:3-methylfumaryl-CoA hydratase